MVDIPGLEVAFCDRTGTMSIRLHYEAHPEKGEEWAKRARRGIPRAKWQREQEIDFGARGGDAVFPMLDDRVHIRHLESMSRCRCFALDHGRQNPCAALWCYIFPDGEEYQEHDLHFYREYYEPNTPIPDNAREIAKYAKGEEPYAFALCDPTMNEELQLHEHSVREEYERWGVPSMSPAVRSEKVSIQRLENYLIAQVARWSIENDRKHYWLDSEGYGWDEISWWADRPALTISPRCPNLFRELRKARYKEHTNPEDKDKPEERKKFDDHLLDCARYILNNEPRWRDMPPPEPVPGTFGAVAARYRERASREASKGSMFSRDL